MNKKKYFMMLIFLLFLLTLIAPADEKDKAKSRELLNLGDRKLNERLFTEAIEVYDQAVELDPNLKQAFNHRGLARLYLDDFTGALSDYDRAIDLDPKFIEAYYNRGLAGLNLKDYNGCISDFDKVIELDEKDAGAYFMRGFAKTYLAEINIDSACADFHKAKELGYRAKQAGLPDADYMIVKYCSKQE